MTASGSIIGSSAYRTGSSVGKVVRGTPDATMYGIDPKQKAAVGALIDATGKNFCTGTLVGDNTVLTAAHCVHNVDPDIIRFAIGEDSARPAHVFEVAKVRKNPAWIAGSPAHDNALLVLTESASAYAAPVFMNREPLTTALVGQQAQNVGYGLTAVSGGTNTRRWWTTEPVTQVAEKYVVVDGQQQSGVCKGDSGGPALYRFANGSLRVIGTLHGGETTCVGLDQYARTDADSTWLRDAGGIQVDTPEQQQAYTFPHVAVEQSFFEKAGIGWLIGGVLAGTAVGMLFGRIGRRG